ncbi:hypothetical protein PG994_006464 [Apiospora phragmitis]|uniref:Uncharacterized protein n=1 Tax=Apiospora phragmitis TaxID=2905665 RepID=A0ABR1VF79_9PEZI
MAPQQQVNLRTAATTSVLASLITCQSLLVPAAAAATILSGVRRGEAGTGAVVAPREMAGLNVWKLYDAVKDYLTAKNAYDPDVPDKCVLLRTTAGGYCQTYVNCRQNNGYGDRMGPWSACFLGGRQYFRHDLVGDFSVTFTQAGGKDGNKEYGLHDPVLQFAALNNWEEMKVQDVLDAQKKSGNNERQLCTGRDEGAGTERKSWRCGLPQLKRASVSAFGINLMYPDADQKSYNPGTAHVIQYQRNRYGNGDKFAFGVQIFDGAGAQIGHYQKTAVDDKSWLSVKSKLPYTFDMQAGKGGKDAVAFKYNGQTWDCGGDKSSASGSSHQCTLKKSGYENGDREGNMGFNCSTAKGLNLQDTVPVKASIFCLMPNYTLNAIVGRNVILQDGSEPAT